MIELFDVTFSYSKSGVPVLDSFSYAFNVGEIVAISGRNGRGKTTLTKLLVGILRPGSGRISIDGEDTSRMDLFDIGRRAGYAFQNPSHQLFCDTVRSEIEYGPRNLGLSPEETASRADELLSFFRLSHLESNFPGTLSYGEKQRTALACVLSMGQRYIVLDEPTTGLDIRARHELFDLLRRVRDERGTGIIVVSHELELLERYADRELVMDA